ncbi:MAG: hypothetical protein K5870_04690 [Lachnospiraceae bacterium]|nr:hypothetical protein [Lachnospiraceae bacterium]
MVDKDKVILMTRLASYEKNEGRKNMNIVNYFRSDYIGLQILKAIIAATLSFVLLLSVYLFYNSEELMANIYKMDMLKTGKNMIIVYLCLVGGYVVIAYFVYTYRYFKAKRSLKDYYKGLRTLENMSDK